VINDLLIDLIITIITIKLFACSSYNLAPWILPPFRLCRQFFPNCIPFLLYLPQVYRVLLRPA
jgi:hypothetical protein